MSNQVAAHQGSWRSHLPAFPPRELLEAKVERDVSHHYWDGDFREFDFHRFAVLRWGKPGATYIVVRGLWVYENNIDPSEPLFLRNTCGLMTCVNPAHVERTAEHKRYMLSHDIQLHDGTFLTPRGQPGSSPIHLCPRDTDYALCGYIYRRRRKFPVCHRHEITCQNCLRVALGLGYVLEEYAPLQPR